MNICCLPLRFTCCTKEASISQSVQQPKPSIAAPSVDEQRALDALAILKLEQVRGAREGEAPGFSVVSVIKTFKDSLETSSPEEIQKNLRGLKELFWHVGIALSELHMHEAGADNVYEKTISDSLEQIEAQAKLIAENLQDPKLATFVSDAITPEELNQMANIYITLNNQREIHGSVTVGDLKPENIYVEFNPKGFAQLTLVNTASLSTCLNSKGEGNGFAFNDVIHMVHSTIEYCVKQGLKFEDLGGILEDFIRGYQLAFKIRLQDRIMHQKIEETEIQNAARSYMPTMLYPLMSLKVMTEIIARNLNELRGMSEDDPQYDIKAKIVRNTTHTIDCETALFKKFLFEELNKLGQVEVKEPSNQVEV